MADRHTQFINTKTNPCRSEKGDAGRFSADTHRYPLVVGTGYCVLDGSKQGGGAEILIGEETFVSTIGSHQVLGQVIGSNTKKVTVAGKYIAGQNSGRGFHHYPYWYVMSVGNTQLIQLSGSLFYERTCLQQIFQGGNHGKHNFYRTVGCCPENGTELDPELSAIAQADTNGTNSKKRIVFFWQIHIGNLFVAANIQGANNQFFSRCSLSHASIKRELFLFVRPVVAGHIKKFCAEQSHTVAQITPKTGRTVGISGILTYLDSMPIYGNGGTCSIQGKLGFSCPLFFGGLQKAALVVSGRADNETACLTSQKDGITVMNVLENVAGSYNGRNT